MRLCVCLRFQALNISKTQPNFFLKHHWVEGKAALDFGPDRIRAPVFIATKSFHRVIMEKTMSPLFSRLFYAILYILAGTDDMHESSDDFEFRPARTTDCGVSCP